MPEHLRALVVILFIATFIFAFAKAPATALASTPGDFERRRNLWFLVTFVAFLAHNFWIYIIVVAIMLFLAQQREPNKVSMFFLLLFAVPAIEAKIPGFGIINHFFAINYIRLLALAVLLPAFLSLWAQSDSDRFGQSLPDKLIVGYIVLNLLLMLVVSTFTDTLRRGVFFAFIDIFLPYYVTSRALKTPQHFRDSLMAFVTATLILCAIGVFEIARYWLLYSPLKDALGESWNLSRYLGREEILRAQASTGQPIVLGYVIATALGFFLYLRRLVPQPMVWVLGLVLLIAGLIAPVSRGPWIGAAATFLIFIAIGPFATKRFAILSLIGAIVLAVLLASPAGHVIVDYLPFVGTVESQNVTYRQRLLAIGTQVIQERPLFGAYDYVYSSSMQELTDGNGIIDIVNTYLGIALGSGLVGLALFSGFFIAAATAIFKAMKTLTDKNDELYLLGQALFSTLIGILIMIFTVSSISVIPVIYWSVAGLGVAYARTVALAKHRVAEPIVESLTPKSVGISGHRL